MGSTSDGLRALRVSLILLLQGHRDLHRLRFWVYGFTKQPTWDAQSVV